MNQEITTEIKQDTDADILFQKIIEGIENQSIKYLSKAITIAESKKTEDITLNERIISYFYTKLYNSERQTKTETSGRVNICRKIGITGAPGAGKSTFIESFGLDLCNQGYKVAVLAIDPSSTLSRGSILGDKTRMNELSNHPNSFIRPSPSSGNLGGVNAKTREAILLCQAAGFDYIIIETVGVGQSEIEVRNLTDFFILLLLPAGGDDLQGIKKGIVEISDLILINKSDGDNIKQARLTLSEYSSILKMLKPTNIHWQRKIKTCSAIERTNFKRIFELMDEFFTNPLIINDIIVSNHDKHYEWAKSLFLSKIIDFALNFWKESKLSHIDYDGFENPVSLSNKQFSVFLEQIAHNENNEENNKLLTPK